MEILGLETSEPIPENFIPLDAIAIVKGLEDGELTVFIRSTETLTDFEALGLLDAAHAQQQKEILDNMESGE